MKRFHALLLSALFSTALSAGNKAQTVKFEEGEQFNLSLSAVNFNRIDVEGERIITVQFPRNAFFVERGKKIQDDLENGVVLKPLAHIPLTVYFTTNHHHHFSATITPTGDLGKTIQFVSKNVKGLAYAKAQEKNQYQASDVMTALMEGTIPSGFQEIAINPATFYLQKHLKVTLLKQYRGPYTSGYVYRIENQSNQSMPLSETYFEHPKLVTMELTEEVLAPKQTAYFYGIYREPSTMG